MRRQLEQELISCRPLAGVCLKAGRDELEQILGQVLGQPVWEYKRCCIVLCDKVKSDMRYLMQKGIIDNGE